MSATSHPWADGTCEICGEPTARGTETESGHLVCPLHASNYEEHDPMLGIGQVLKLGARRSTGTCLHIPDESGDEPICDRTRHKTGGRTKGWMKRDLSAYPPVWREWCTLCVRKITQRVE